ncbi:MAG: ABC-F family ATP-binding cassette domain-containing protein, partial [Planctomycetes bacterium]|nr:ABC-F family ATP-binding cassette domain-containing protein [Planctomycetota bacterium]
MAILFELCDLELTLGGHPILDGVSHSFLDDRKYALIGRNGTGKTTLCRIIEKETEPDSGSVRRDPSLRIGYLQQGNDIEGDENCIEYLMRSGKAEEWRCGEIAASFGFDTAKQAMPASSLSGGWRTLLKLAGLVVLEPNFLILDEPTNFLDLRTQIILEKFVRNWAGGAMVISHDRAFLKRTCAHTLELSLGKLHSYPGTVEDYLDHREERIEHARRVNATNVSKMKQLQQFIDKNRAGANTASQARSKQKQLDRIKLMEVEMENYSRRIRLPSPSPLRKTVYECNNLAIGYGEKVIAKNINFSVEPGDRVAIVG